MLKKSTNYLNLISIIIIVYLAFIPLKPHNIQVKDVLSNHFEMQKAYDHILAMTKAPHYIGSENHRAVQSYIVRQLQKLGLQVQIQKTNISNRHKVYSRVENILAKIKGSNPSGKSIVLMSHYDSVDFASRGAGDDASGVAVVLEGLRTYLAQNGQPKNDIVVLITDAEEVGLLGAKAFVNKHPWAKNVGTVLNFEARGSSGSSIMLMETNGGNHQLLNTYVNANVTYPNSNSLAYSIYKLLPNDTDLSVFRKDKDIVGYNFAFIDDHFNYHTSLDTLDNLSMDTLAHQAFYFISMLDKLNQTNLQQLQSDEDDVYFHVPYLKTFSYSFDLAMAFSLIILMAFVIIVFIGVKNKTLRPNFILTGSYPLFKSALVTVILCFILLKFLYWLHPHYSEILQGFTYNGYAYIAFFMLLTIAICLFFYRKTEKTHNASELMVVPIFMWIAIGFLSAEYLTGAHFFIVISLMGSLSLLINVLLKKSQTSLSLLLYVPVILIFSPFFVQLPVALGLVALPVTCLLLVLFVSPIIHSLQIPKQFKINQWLVITALMGSYVFAELSSSFSPLRPLPDSLYYFQDNESNSAYWMSIDNKTDDWNTQFFAQSKLTTPQLKEFNNQHYNWAKVVATTENKNIVSAKVETIVDRKYSDKHVYQLKITPQRPVNILNLINNNAIHVLKLTINNQNIITKEQLIKKKSRLARIYNNIEGAFIVDIEIATDESLDFYLLELSPDLLTSQQFKIPPRPAENIAKPFVLSDSIITKQRVKL
jgi:hypothetical protein